MKQYGILSIIGILLIFAACNSARPAFEENVAIAEGMWDKDNAISVIMPVEDTLQYYNLQLYIRNRNDYPYSNLYLFVTSVAPSGATVTDTVQYRLAEDNGKWIGKGSSQMWDNRFPFYSNIRFAVKGNYRFIIRHGMRNNVLPGISDVGLRLVEKE